MKKSITSLFLAGGIFACSFAQQGNEPIQEDLKKSFEELGVKVIISLQKQDEKMFKSCFISWEDYLVIMERKKKSLPPDFNKEQALQEMEEKIIGNYQQLVEFAAASGFNWSDAKINSFNTPTEISPKRTDLGIELSVEKKLYGMKLDDNTWISGNTWKIMDGVGVWEVLSEEEQQAQHEEMNKKFEKELQEMNQVKKREDSLLQVKAKEVDLIVAQLLSSMKANKKDDFVGFAGTEEDQKVILGQMVIPGADEEQMKNIRKTNEAKIPEKVSRGKSEAENVWNRSKELATEKKLNWSKAEIAWDEPQLLDQMGNNIADITAYITENGLLYKMQFNLIKGKDKWIFNFPTPLGFMGSLKENGMEGKFQEGSVYKKL